MKHTHAIPEGYLALALALIVASCANQVQSQSASPDTAHQTHAPKLAADSTSSVAKTSEAGDLQILSVLSVEHSLDVLAQRDGIVMNIPYDQDTYVKKGAILAQLDDRELLTKLQDARLALEVTENNLKFQLAMEKAKQAAYRRQQELHKYGLSSHAALEQAEFEAKGAGYDADSWRADVKRKQAAIQELGIELEKTRVIAPFGGYVVRRYIKTGQNVVKNDPCFHISELYPLEVHFLVPLSTGSPPKAGLLVKVALVEGGSETCQARVVRVSPTVDPGSASYDVTAQLEGAGLAWLRPGMTVKVLWPLLRRTSDH